MKRTALINIICSMVAAVIMVIGVMLALVATDVFDVEQKKLILSSSSSTIIYNGEALTDDEWHLTEGELKDGHTLSVNVSGSQTNVGISENHISARVLDENGADVTSDYTLEYKPGVLNVKARDIGIIADSAMKRYDGTPLTSDKYTLESAMALIATDTLDVVIEGSITEVGETKNAVKAVTITNEGGEDVTRNYNVSAVDGKLIVYDDDTLVIKTDSDQKEFDGTALRNDNWELVSGELLPSHSLNVNVTGYRVAVGVADNVFDVTILDENGNDVTDSYDILKVNGRLTVIRADVTVKSLDAQKVYDKTPLTESGFSVEPNYYQFRGFIFDVVITGSQTEVGSSENTIESCVIYAPDGETDLSENFNITIENGTLTVTDAAEAPVNIVFASASDSKTYDGTPLTNTNWSIQSGTLMDGHSPVVEVSGSITEAGQTDNTFEVSIVDEKGNDVTEKYSIEKQLGILEVFGIDIKITADSAQKVYDGEPLVAPTAKILPTYVAESYTIEYQVIGSQTEVGTSDNTVSYCRVYDSNGEEITGSFNITREKGTLTVLAAEEDIKPELTYLSGGGTKIYDGMPLMCNECSRVEGELLVGHREVIQITASVTKAGNEDNIYTVTIYDENNEDVTHMYDITCNYGVLEVLQRPISIKANDGEKIHDGQPLIDSGVTVSCNYGKAIVDGDVLHTTVVGQITEVGTAKNVVSSWSVTNSKGEDVSFCYDVTTVDGELSVTEEDGDIDGGGSNVDNDKVWFKVTSDSSGAVYLKLYSFGDYDGHSSWSAAPTDIKLTSDGRSVYYLSSYAIGNSGESPTSITIDPVGGVYALPYYTAYDNGNAIQSDVMIQKNTTDPYTVSYYNVSYDLYNGNVYLPNKYTADAAAYATYARDTYLYVDSDTAAVLDKIIAENGFNKNDANIINDVAKYIRTAAEYNLDYNEETGLDNADNRVVEFLTVAKQGVCRHYAEAATLMFRRLGIPARYTVGFMENVKAGEETDITGARAHAWVEVYIDSVGWVKVEVTGSDSNSAAPKKLTITPEITREQYTGVNKELSAKEAVLGFADLEEEYDYIVSIPYSINEPGRITTKIESFIIYEKNNINNKVYEWRDGKVLLGEDKFDITYKTGVLQIYREHLIFSSVSLEKTYDGTALLGTKEGVSFSSNNLPEGYSYEIRNNSSITKVGKVSNQFTVIITNQNGRKVTDEFWISGSYGTLTVTARNITVTAESDERTFNGTPLVCNEIKIDEATVQLAVDDNITYYEVSGSCIIGTASNVISDIIITNKNGEDVTFCYAIKYVDGTLTVKLPNK